jgi:AraC-like DNA-binding protein
VKTRQTIRTVPFASPAPLGVEVMTFARLRAMAAPGYLAVPQRPAFHLLLLTTAGSAPHTVDFETHELTPRRTVWVRPGQVQLFGVTDGPRPPAGDLVLFQPDFLIPGTSAAAIADDRFGPVVVAHSPSARAGIDRARRELRREYADAASAGRISATRTETLRHLLSVLVLRLGADGDENGEGDDRGDLFHRFRTLLERDFAVAHDVGHYADALGYSARTLARATQAAAGRTPKQAIQDRIALEARRLLAHTDLPSSTIATQLGFSDPSNFSAFFLAHAAVTPTAFRARERRRP